MGETQLFLGVLLMVSLFLNESWVLGNATNSSDDALYSILSFVFIIFLLESVILSFVQPKYFMGFFFWMDILGTFSILFDIGWIADTIFSGSGNSTSILRATRAAKLGARYGRLMRILKLMKFIKFLPCFKKEGDEEPEPTLSAVRRVSNSLTNVLSQRVAGLVMLMVIVLPFMSYNQSISDSSVNAFLRTLKLLAKEPTTPPALFTAAVGKFENFYKAKDQKLQSISIKSPNTGITQTHTYFSNSDIRTDNLVSFTTNYLNPATGVNDVTITAVMDQTIPHKMDALYGMMIILLVIFVLVFFSASFQNAVDSLMVAPLEKIMTALRNSATVMLKSMKAMETEDDKIDDDDEGELETEMLERMVEKLVKIVSHMSGGKAIQELADANVDKATANWLSSTYNDANQTIVLDEDALQKEEFHHQKRITSLSDVTLPVKLELLNSWDFDTLLLDEEQLSDVFMYIFNVLNAEEEFKVPPGACKAFLKEISGKYLDNTYHNYKHGYDVAHTVWRLVSVPSLNLIFSHLEFLSLIVAAVGHDVGHPGVNNLYLVKSKNELALLHNDRSPLENMHCSVVYDVLSRPATNIFVNLTDKQWRDSRKIILGTILGTDMSHHFDQISKTQLFLEVNGDDTAKFCSGQKDTIDALSEEKDRMFLMEICLHCADISNPYKPFKICAKWADLVVEEFCRQGDREEKEGLEISPMMDRKAINLCNMQMGFIEFVVAPLVIAFISIFPPHYQMGYNMADNYCCWGEKRKLEIKLDDKIANKDEECAKVITRMEKFRQRFSMCDDLKGRNRRGSSTVTVDEVATLKTVAKK